MERIITLRQCEKIGTGNSSKNFRGLQSYRGNRDNRNCEGATYSLANSRQHPENCDRCEFEERDGTDVTDILEFSDRVNRSRARALHILCNKTGGAAQNMRRRVKTRSKGTCTHSTQYKKETNSELELHHSTFDSSDGGPAQQFENKNNLPVGSIRTGDDGGSSASIEGLDLTSSSERMSQLCERKLQELQKRFELRNYVFKKGRNSDALNKNIMSTQNRSARPWGPRSYCEEWAISCMEISPSFIYGSEARMEITQSATPISGGYSAMPLQVYNISDISTMYTKKWAVRSSLSHAESSFEELRLSVGQYARFCVAHSVIDLQRICEEGAVFGLLCEFNAVRAFMTCFQLRAAASTVASKANHLKSAANDARIFFATKREISMSAKAETVSEYLLCVAAANKKEARIETNHRRSQDFRLQHGRQLMSSDFLNLRKYAEEHLQTLLKYVNDAPYLYGNAMPEKIRWVACQRNILKQWCKNFTGLLIVTASGQRPQIFSQLLCPAIHELELMKRRGVVTFRTIMEKTTRSSEFVGFPIQILQYLQAHIEVFRPAILCQGSTKKFVPSNNNDLESPLLLHALQAVPLSTSKLRAELRNFLTSVDPELDKLTVMDIRASYASLMLSKFRTGEIFRGISETTFIAQLARIMSTSEEQLRNTYISNDEDDYVESIKEIASSWNV